GQPLPPPSPPAAPGPDTASENARAAKAPVRKRRKSRLAAAGLVAVLAVGVALGAPALLKAVRSARIADPPPPVALRPAIKPVSDAAPAPRPEALASQLSGPMSNPALGQAAGIVRD